MVLEREVTRVEEFDGRVRVIAFEGIGAGRQEEGVVLAPDRQKTRFMRAEVFLEFRIERDVALVVAEEIELDLVSAGSGQIEIVERIAVRGDGAHIGYAVRVLPERRLRLEECTQRRAIGLGRIFPIGLDRVPTFAQAFLIRVAVLRDDRSDALGVFQRDTKTGRRAVVEDVDRELL